VENFRKYPTSYSAAMTSFWKSLAGSGQENPRRELTNGHGLIALFAIARSVSGAGFRPIQTTIVEMWREYAFRVSW